MFELLLNTKIVENELEKLNFDHTILHEKHKTGILVNEFSRRLITFGS